MYSGDPKKVAQAPIKDVLHLWYLKEYKNILESTIHILNKPEKNG